MQKNYINDVISLPVEFDKEKIKSRYRLAIAVAKRAKDLFYGEIPRISTNARKVTTVALQEVISGSVRVLTGKDAVKAGEAAERRSQKPIMDEASQKVSFPEKLTELEKDLEEYLRRKEKINS